MIPDSGFQRCKKKMRTEALKESNGKDFPQMDANEMVYTKASCNNGYMYIYYDKETRSNTK